MRNKAMFLVGALALATIPLASAATRDVSFDEPTMAGNVQLKAGNYKVTVKGSDATFTYYRPSPYMWAMPEMFGKSVTVPVDREVGGHKFARTEVMTQQIGDGSEMRLDRIQLGGTHTVLEFSGD